MIIHYAIKRFISFFLWLCLFIEIFFTVLQLTTVQNKLISLFLPDDINIELVSSGGVFPFNFSVKKINIKSRDFKGAIHYLEEAQSLGYNPPVEYLKTLEPYRK